MKNKIFIFFFLALWFVPPIITFFEFSEFTLITAIVIAFYIVIHQFIFRSSKFNIKSIGIIMLCSVLVVCNFLSSLILFSNEVDINRFLFSFLILLTFLFGANLFSKLVGSLNVDYMNSFFKKLFYFFVVIAISTFFTFKLFPHYNHAMFPFMEPSHFGIFFAPILCYNVLVENDKMRLMHLLSGLLIGIFVKNLTLMVTIIVLSLFVYGLYVVPLGVIAGVLFYSFSDIEYFSSRLSFLVEKTDNLSALVYIKGWEVAMEGLNKSDGLGIGFQQLGIVEIETDAGRSIIDILGMNLNEKDGGFLAAKLISELGILGILSVLIYLSFFFKFFRQDLKNAMKEISVTRVLVYSSFISFFSEIFVRGIGYFSSTSFLFLVSIFLIVNNNLVKKSTNYLKSEF